MLPLYCVQDDCRGIGKSPAVTHSLTKLRQADHRVVVTMVITMI